MHFPKTEANKIYSYKLLLNYHVNPIKYIDTKSLKP